MLFSCGKSPYSFRANTIKEVWSGHHSIVNPSTPPLCYQHQYTFLLTYTLPSRVEREMSIDMVNDVLDVMTVDPTDDGSFSLMDNTVSGKTRTVLFTVKDS